MPNTNLYTGALKIVRPRANSVSGTGALPLVSQERFFKVPDCFIAAAKTWLEGEQGQACQLKTAASIVFVRDGKEGLETILTYRPNLSPLGTVAFPGGLCLPADREPIPWAGPSTESWAAAFKEEDILAAQAAVVGAIRESFEETGFLLAGIDDTSTVELAADAADQMAAREAVAQGEKTLADYLNKRGLKLRTDLLKPLGRWQSPDYRHRRYDTHYFASAVPIGQNPKLLASKGIWGDWVNVRQLLEARETTELGDKIGREDTVGRTLEELVTPGALCLLENLAAASTAVSFLTQKRNVQVKKAEIVEQNGEYLLRYTVPLPAGAREKCSIS